MSEKEEYFKISKESGVPKRCPIIDRCRRRSNTIALFNDLDVEEGIKWAALKEPYIEIKGEAPYRIAGNSNWFFSGLCPEISLFEQSVAVFDFAGAPITSGQYDKYMSPKFEVLDKGHFSECAEYVDYHISDNLNNNTNNFSKEDKQPKNGFVAENWQWLIGTIIAIVGILLGVI